ncbi:Lrp/AsnC family transcriptional regulator [Halobellus sp. Atlit-38R]|uniref:Lrp/AsnC family transcriptional regulator n=1 Tax=Halobellus sp. Atlit-38R TaxID=2282131 RepID=UPI000EF26011|nr:Lrp/AsnC family transcriptional regulator [Halobellus sp. Atlit-38R]RLM89372.1 Lrp/AsnC family transcriptional regulator [Halobellus sp. Atlit-38R]
MDEKDIRILKTLAREKTSGPEQIEAETGIPKSTVHYRLKQLREDGVIENDLYDMDLSKMGVTLTVISEVNAKFDEGYHEVVGEKLADLESVSQVYFTMGDTDFIVIAHVTKREKVESLIASYESIDEIQRTSSKFVITTVKNEPRPINDLESETLLEAIENL